MTLHLFGVACVLLLAADAGLMTAGIRKNAPRIRLYTYGLVLLQCLACFLGAWYFSSDIYTYTSRGCRDGFFEMLLCLAGAGIYMTALLICMVFGYRQRVYEITGF